MIPLVPIYKDIKEHRHLEDSQRPRIVNKAVGRFDLNYDHARMRVWLVNKENDAGEIEVKN